MRRVRRQRIRGEDRAMLKLVSNFTTVGLTCTCPKRKCVRWGDCAACREFHQNTKRPQPPRCEREPGYLKRMLAAFRAKR